MFKFLKSWHSRQRNYYRSADISFQTAVSCGGSQLFSFLPIHFVFQTAVSCRESQLISIPPMHVVCLTAVSCGENQLISIPPMHVVFQTAVSFGGSQLIGWETSVASLGDFSPKTQV
jgi:hypothetical protein